MYKVAAWFYIKVTKDTSIRPLTYKIPKATSTIAKGYNVEDYVREKEEIKEEHTKEVNEVKEEVKATTETEA